MPDVRIRDCYATADYNYKFPCAGRRPPLGASMQRRQERWLTCDLNEPHHDAATNARANLPALVIATDTGLRVRPAGV